MAEKEGTSELRLGWQVTEDYEPRFWLKRDARAGSQTEKDLVMISSPKLAAHTVIIAQSGSGKSSFLGRLVEELLLWTRARCLILDPNSDFRTPHLPAPKDRWEKGYEEDDKSGYLHTESSWEEFDEKWSRVTKAVWGGRSLGTEEPYRTLQLWWPSLSVDFLAEDLNAFERNELYHCHEFVRAIASLSILKSKAVKKPVNAIDAAEEIYGRAA